MVCLFRATVAVQHGVFMDMDLLSIYIYVDLLSIQKQ